MKSLREFKLYLVLYNVTQESSLFKIFNFFFGQHGKKVIRKISKVISIDMSWMYTTSYISIPLHKQSYDYTFSLIFIFVLFLWVTQEYKV